MKNFKHKLMGIFHLRKISFLERLGEKFMFLKKFKIHRKSKQSKKRTYLKVSIILGFLALFLGFIISLVIFNVRERAKDIHREVTFLDAHQALVFWKTDQPTIGYIKYGKKKSNMDQTIYQTSSVPGLVHAVVVSEIPLEGVYISLHNESDSRFLWADPFEIKFNEEELESM